MNRKLHSHLGETLTETLAAILLVSLSAMVLATLLLAATRINRSAGEGDRLFREEQTVAETQAPGGTEGEVTIAGAASGSYRVQLSGGDGKLTAYSYKKGGGA